MCNDQTDKLCFEDAINQLEAKATKSEICKQTCQVVECRTELERTIKSSREPWSFEYHFVIPESSKDIRIMRPFKYVYKEYLIMSEISLIGNVGGTLGLFVGFSFLGTSEWLIEAFPRLLRWAKQKLGQCEMEVH